MKKDKWNPDHWEGGKWIVEDWLVETQRCGMVPHRAVWFANGDARQI